MIDEVWKDIPGYDGYQASTLGRIKSVNRVRPQKNRWGTVTNFFHKGQILKSTKRKNKYEQVSLSINGRHIKREVHYFVAITFLGEIKKGMEINHIDFNKQNNSVKNLEIVSKLKNIQHNITFGRHNRSKLTPDLVRQLRAEIKLGKQTMVELAKKYKISYTNIKMIKYREIWDFID